MEGEAAHEAIQAHYIRSGNVALAKVGQIDAGQVALRIFLLTFL